jgi:hypothetical protein
MKISLFIYRLTRIASISAALLLMDGAYCHAASASAVSAAADEAHQTVILIRHGEKPAEGLGQLNCQGLNRALALPSVLLAKFGKPDFLFAPDPAQQNVDHGQSYYYIRPLATLEPTAIQFGMPIATPFGFKDIDKLRLQLDQPAYRNAHVVIAWEHTMAERLARNLVQSYGGNPSQVPRWNSDDFDSIYIVKVDRRQDTITTSFSVDREGLDKQSSVCPGPAPIAP